MKPITKTLTTTLLLVALVGNVLADGRRGYYPHGGHRHHPPTRHHDTGWVAPLLFLGLAGAVIGAAASHNTAPQPTYVTPQPQYVPPPVTYVPPAPAYIAPPAVVPAPPPQPVGTWYFCRSVGQYYPYTPVCPEGWQPVPATPAPY